MNKDDYEIIRLSCDKCKKHIEATYAKLFGNLVSPRLLPKMMCKCGGKICVSLTGKYDYKGMIERMKVTEPQIKNK